MEIPQTVTIPFAMLAGLFSFVSPCVLPLVPAYIGYLSAQATSTIGSSLVTQTAGSQSAAGAEASPSRWAVALHGLFFVLGFSVIFLLLGITAGAIGQLGNAFFANRDWVSRIGGILIIVLGLHTMGVIRIPFLYYDTRRQEAPRQEYGLLGSALMGLTFAAGWSPCIGPFLTAIFALGADTASVGQAMILLMAYAAGLGIPFLLTALLIDQASASLRKLQKHMRKVEIASGVLLIAIGILVFMGSMQRLSAYFTSWTEFSINLDNWLVQLSGGGE